MAKAKGKAVVRETVIGITINVLTSEGHCKTLTIDPSRTEALFWSDRAVNEILAPFYERIEKYTTREELINRFGVGIKKTLTSLGGNDEQVRITPELIKEMWQLTHENGDGVSYIEKTRQCIPRPCR
ncbi:hypothetical protein NN484_09255 [Pseudomonas serboccidentalis]|uniref:Uncharacterized protein n=1 Tax=Pseudomonas serboccidentalis TaxID=2964670 RepID=A0ABY7ZDT8_9PSED|nr:hypothetical protein [Pseudomonas serboccidentalis]WDR37906.1 hypothetical protein NN484_09255 [Pseudomonas serboccidentalis]